MADVASLRVAIDARGARRGATEYEQAQRRIKRASGRARKDVKGVDDQVDHLGKSAAMTKRILGGLFAGTAMTLAARKTLRILTDFETGLVGVGKTADLEGEALDALGQDIVKLSMRIPAATNELLAIAQAAGQLGVTGHQNILLFTETVAKLGSASDLSGEQAATTLARLLNITGESIGSVDVLASVIVALGNKYAASESDIAHHASSVAQATVVYRTTSAEAAALGTALAALNIRAELGGSSVGRAFRAMDDAIRSGGAELEALATLTGTTGDEITKVFRDNAVDAFQMFLAGLNDVIESGGSAKDVLAQFGLQGEEVLKTLPTLATRADLVAEALARGRAEAANATALDEEARRANETLASAKQKLNNTLAAVILKYRESNGVLKQGVDIIKETVAVLFGLDGGLDEVSRTARILAVSIELVAKWLTIMIGIKVAAWLAASVVAMGGFTGACYAAGVALWQLAGVLMAHPIFALAAVLGTVAAAWWTFRDGVADSTDEVARLNDELDETGRILGQINSGWAQFMRGREIGDVEEQISGLRSVKRTLEQTSRDIIEAQMAGDSGKVMELVQDAFEHPRLQGMWKPTEIPSDERGIHVMGSDGRPGGFISASQAREVLEKGIGQLADGIAELSETLPAPAGGSWDKKGGASEEAQAILSELASRKELAGLSDAERTHAELMIRYRQQLADFSEDERAAYLEKIDAAAREALAAEAGAQAQRQQHELYERTMAAARELVTQAETEMQLASLSADDREVKLGRMRVEQMLAEGTLALSEDQRNAVEAQLDAYEKITRERQAALHVEQTLKGWAEQTAKKMAEMNREAERQRELAEKARLNIRQRTFDMHREREILGMSPEEQADARAIMEANRIIGDAWLPDRQQLVDDYVEARKALEAYRDELRMVEDQERRLAEIGDRVGDSFARAFEDIVVGAADAGDAVKALVQDIARLVIRQTITGPMASGISSILQSALSGAIGGGMGGAGAMPVPSALGNIFDRGQLVPFAMGGVISGPVTFPLEGGRTGLMGENGPEAVMPLRRGTDGRLGVDAGGGANGSQRPVVVNINVQAQDANSFRASHRQIQREMTRALSRSNR